MRLRVLSLKLRDRFRARYRIPSQDQSPVVPPLLLYSKSQIQPAIPHGVSIHQYYLQGSSHYMERASPTPNLLTLPREIRDIIYGYLHHPMKLRNHPGMPYRKTDPTWASHANCSHFVHEDIYRMRLSHLPYSAVLHAHTRLSEEYKESTIFNNISATFHWGQGVVSGRPEPHLSHVVLQLFAHVSHIDIVLLDVSDTKTKEAMVWCAKELWSHCSLLRSFRFTRSNTLAKVYSEDLESRLQGLNPDIQLRTAFSPPPEIYGLPLQRHGEGYRVGISEDSSDEWYWEGTISYNLDRIQVCHYGSYMMDHHPWRIEECSQYEEEAPTDINMNRNEEQELLKVCGKLREWKEWLH